MIEIDKRRIQAIIANDTDPSTFYQEFVAAFGTMVQAHLGLAWNCEEEPFAPICQVARDDESMVRLPLSSQRHQALLSQAFETKEASIIAPAGQGEATPSILISPIRKGDSVALVEFILPADRTSEENNAVFRALAECCRAANRGEDLVGQPAVAAPPSTAGTLALHDLDEFTSLVHSSLEIQEAARQIANEARRVLDCDRVTVFRKTGRKFRALAISGQPVVNHRSNEVKALTELATTVLATDRPFWFPTENDVPQQIQQPLDNYVHVSMTRSLVVLPIYDQPEFDPADLRDEKAPKRLIGGLAIEQANCQWNRTLVEPAIQSVTKHASVAFRNAHQVDSIFLLPLWRKLGHARTAWAGSALSRSLLAIACLALLILALVFWQIEMSLACGGRLVPQQRQRIFADQTGTVTSINVQHGDSVANGQVLLVLENDELEIQKEQLLGELAVLQERLSGDRSIRIRQQGRSESRSEVESSRFELQSQIDSIQRRLDTIRRKEKRLEVKSNLTGQVMTWDLATRLGDRPVQQGDLLLEVADTAGQWQLELDLQDRKVGHLMRAVEASDEPLKVRFSLASEPGKRFVGTVREIEGATSVNDERLHMVRVHVDVNEQEIADIMHAGGVVNAKISCGDRSLGFVWLHDVWAFLQYRAFFYLW